MIIFLGFVAVMKGCRVICVVGVIAVVGCYRLIVGVAVRVVAGVKTAV